MSHWNKDLREMTGSQEALREECPRQGAQREQHVPGPQGRSEPMGLRKKGEFSVAAGQRTVEDGVQEAGWTGPHVPWSGHGPLSKNWKATVEQRAVMVSLVLEESLYLCTPMFTEHYSRQPSSGSNPSLCRWVNKVW